MHIKLLRSLFFVFITIIIMAVPAYAKRNDSNIIPLKKYNAVYYILPEPGEVICNGFTNYNKYKIEEAKNAYFSSADMFFNIYEGRPMQINYIIDMVSNHPSPRSLQEFQKLKLEEMDYLVLIFVNEVPRLGQAESIVKMDIYDLKYSPDRPVIVYHGEQSYIYNTQRNGYSISIRNIWNDNICSINKDFYKKVIKLRKD